MTITPRLVGEHQIPGLGQSLHSHGSFELTRAKPRVLVGDDTSLRVYELGEQAVPLATFPRPPAAGPHARYWLAPDLSYAVFQGTRSYEAIRRDGRPLWELAFDGWDAVRCAYVHISEGGSRVWVRLPSGKADETLFVTLDATTGEALARSVLPVGGYERGVGLDWGPDGLHAVHVSDSASYEALLIGDEILIGDPIERAMPFLISVNPSGDQGMEVDERGRYVRWHHLGAAPEVAAELTMAAFPPPGTGDCDVHDRPYFNLTGGYVDDGTALVVLYNGYTEAIELRYPNWREYSHWLADPTTATLHGRVTYPQWDTDFVQPLGDGTWLTNDWDTLHRWSAR